MRVRGEARQVEVRLDLQRMRILLRDQHRHIELVREVDEHGHARVDKRCCVLVSST